MSGDAGQPRRRWADVFDDWLVGKSSIADWLLESLVRPDNLPAYLNALFSLFLALFAYFAWTDAKETGRQTQQQLDLLRDQQRPWIFVEEARVLSRNYSNVFPEKKVMFLQIEFRLSNSGRTPGEFVKVSDSALISHVNRKHPLNDIEDALKFIRNCSTERFARFGGLAIFPQTTYNTKTVFESEDDVANQAMEAAQFSPVFFTAIVCIKYASPTDAKVHFTASAFDIRAAKSAEPGKPSELSISPNGAYGSAAN